MVTLCFPESPTRASLCPLGPRATCGTSCWLPLGDRLPSPPSPRPPPWASSLPLKGTTAVGVTDEGRVPAEPCAACPPAGHCPASRLQRLPSPLVPPAAPGPKGQATCSSSLQRASCRSCEQRPPGAGRGLHASRNGAPALGGGAQPVPPSRSEARPLSAVGSGGAASFSRDSHAARFSHFRGANRRVSAPSVSPTSRSTFESFPHPRKKLLTHQE